MALRTKTEAGSGGDDGLIEIGVNERRPAARKIICGCIIIVAIAAIYLILWKGGYLGIIMDSKRLHAFINRAGAFGPLLIIALMAGAIVANPIPSAPIALAAGLAYGHTWGTIYVVIGSLTGALIAFTIARLVGHEILARWFGDRLKVGLLGSQNTLTGIVFVSRLLPFISFDIVSYAAGLTEIRWWRFAAATFVGIIPASFLLAHFGSEMGTGDVRRISLSVLALGALTLIPITVKIIVDRRKKKGAERNP
jgi:uncharacterized membrane protein YdjX (TVP38/TMEM64 family)